MIRGLPTTIFASTLAGVVGIGLFFIKHEVKEQEARLAELNQEIQRNQEVIHVLKAEWSYLNDPARLRALSEKFLSMKVMAPSQIVTLNALPSAGPVYAARQPQGAPAVAAKPAPAAPAPALAKAEPAKKPAVPALPAPAVAAAAPAPQPAPKSPAGQPGKPVYQPAPSKLAQSPAAPALARPLPAPQPGPAPAPQPGPGRTIVIQSPAIAESPAYPGEVR